MQAVPDALCAIPFQAVQILPDWVVLILVCNHRQRPADAVFVVQSVSFFQIQHEVVEVCITHGRGGAFPPQGLTDVNAACEDIIADEREKVSELSVKDQDNHDLVLNDATTKVIFHAKAINTKPKEKKPKNYKEEFEKISIINNISAFTLIATANASLIYIPDEYVRTGLSINSSSSE